MNLNTSIITIKKDTSNESYFNSEEYNKAKYDHLLYAYHWILMPKNVYFEETFMATLGTTCNTITHIEQPRKKDYEEFFPLLKELKSISRAATFSPGFTEQNIDEVLLALEHYGLNEYIQEYDPYIEKLWMSLIGIFDSGDPNFAENHDKIYE